MYSDRRGYQLLWREKSHSPTFGPATHGDCRVTVPMETICSTYQSRYSVITSQGSSSFDVASPVLKADTDSGYSIPAFHTPR